MIRLRCTKKLLTKLPLHEDGRLRSRQSAPAVIGDSGESPLSGWHANLITLQRRQCVLFVHDNTRFPVFVPALKKAAEKMLAPLGCDTDTNRSVQGTLNRMAQDLGCMLEYDQCSVMELSPYRERGQVCCWLFS